MAYMHDIEHLPAATDPILIDLHGRVGRLERTYADLKENDNRAFTELALIKQDIHYIKDGQDKLYLGVNRLLWAFGLAVIGATSTFILSGGLLLK